MSELPPASVPSSHPDQLQTVPFDASPIINTFYGPRDAEIGGHTNQQHELPDDDSTDALLRARTRRLDSFRANSTDQLPADAVEDQGEQERVVSCEEAQDHNEPADSAPVMEPKNLSSVFDEQAGLVDVRVIIGV